MTTALPSYTTSRDITEHIAAASEDDPLEEGLNAAPGHSFFRGEAMRIMPNAARMNRPSALAKYVADGIVPTSPFIDSATSIVAFGSCFATNISRYLNNIGYNVATEKDNIAYVSRLGDGIVNTFAIRQQFEWAWLGTAPTVDLWQGLDRKSVV